ncbi:Dabb family protein [Aureibaculum luteum]|uniref:Dabb family protein n=1 Tax=Aureibaculum luteum TaxID=1548456 RepID=UPI000E4C8D69|nr:Dabb family protein [Aureibaculum luteum]
MTQGNFAHNVFFWLKNPDSAVDRAAFEKSLINFISQSVFIKTKHVGTPAQTDREVIDSTYSFSLLLTFATKKDHDAYQIEPNHKRFIEESSPLWKKVVVYDSVNILP